MSELITKATPEQTPNSSVIKETTAFFNRSKIPPPVRLTQYDNLPFIAVRLVEGDEYYTVPVGAAVNIRMKKPDGTIVYNPAFGLSEDRHTVYIEATTQMTVCPGHVSPILEVVVNSEQAGTAYLHFEIERNPVQEDDIESTDEGKTITQLVQAAQDAADAAAASEEAAADSAKDAQGAKTDAETAAEQANTAKTEAQTAAEQANTAKTEAQTAAGQANTAKTEAQTAATNAEDSADAAADSAQKAAIEAQKALGFRSYFGGQVVPDANGDLDPSRPMSTPTAASVTIKARGDRIAGLTMAGKTTQAGTGDPSPDNIRMISGVGAYDQMVVLDGSSSGVTYSWNTSTSTPFLSITVWGMPRVSSGTQSKSSYLALNSVGSSSLYNIFVLDSAASGIYVNFRLGSDKVSTQSEAAYKEYLSAHPLIVWYRSVDYARSTGPFYTVVELSQDPYHAVGFELNQPLFDGDSLEVSVPSGCDKQIKLDGSAVQVVASGGNYAVSADDAAGPAYASGLTGLTVSDGVIIIPDSYFPASVTDASTANSWLQDNPQTVFYRSTSYSQENDIPVALESHETGYRVLTGEESNWILGSINQNNIYVYQSRSVGATGEATSSFSHFKQASAILSPSSSPDKTNQGWVASEDALRITIAHDVLGTTPESTDGVSKSKDWLSSQYSAGTPVQVVYKLATPVTYARPVPTMIAQPGEDGTFTVTGENSLSVLLKAFQDGGDAATLNGKKWQVFEIDVPASAWTGSGTNYTAVITLSGMTAALNVVACALGSSYVGTDAAEKAMAQWDYLETGANTVTFHAAVKPTANFGVVLTTVS